jgi:hypothetical protein
MGVLGDAMKLFTGLIRRINVDGHIPQVGQTM